MDQNDVALATLLSPDHIDRLREKLLALLALQAGVSITQIEAVAIKDLFESGVKNIDEIRSILEGKQNGSSA